MEVLSQSDALCTYTLYKGDVQYTIIMNCLGRITAIKIIFNYKNNEILRLDYAEIKPMSNQPFEADIIIVRKRKIRHLLPVLHKIRKSRDVTEIVNSAIRLSSELRRFSKYAEKTI